MTSETGDRPEEQQVVKLLSIAGFQYSMELEEKGRATYRRKKEIMNAIYGVM